MKGHIITIGMMLAVAGAISLFTARRIDAQYASPVRVMNSTSFPALASSIDDHGRIPYQATIQNNACSPGACSFSLPSPPAGHRLVIERVGGFGRFRARPPKSAPKW